MNTSVSEAVLNKEFNKLDTENLCFATEQKQFHFAKKGIIKNDNL